MWVRPAFLVACVLAGCAGSDETARDRWKGHHKRKKAGREESDARPEAGAGLAQTKSRLVRQVQSATAFCAAAKRRRTRRSYGDSASGVRLQPFVVLSRQHSGSTWLGLVLDGRPCVVCGNEKFHEARPPYVFGDAEARRQAMLKALETVGLRPRGGDGDALDAFYADLGLPVQGICGAGPQISPGESGASVVLAGPLDFVGGRSCVSVFSCVDRRHATRRPRASPPPDAPRRRRMTVRTRRTPAAGAPGCSRPACRTRPARTPCTAASAGCPARCRS